MNQTTKRKALYTLLMFSAALIFTGQGCADKISYSGKDTADTSIQIDKSIIPETDSENIYAYDIGYARPALTPGQTAVSLVKKNRSDLRYSIGKK
ncbi:MAG: hypothetical protein HYY51_02710 [Candidatus Magasanikbacteria bacterium]|nr:hypothetical protein [Candidatus Magasanikbacteria bacterium]